jgi:hypothetical protein
MKKSICLNGPGAECIPSAALVRVLALKAEREQKHSLREQTPERVEKPKPSRWPWLLLGLAASYFSIHVLVAVVRAMLR